MFYGKYRKNLDDKDRVVFPAEFRSAAGKDEAYFLTVTPGDDPCISVFPESKFKELFLGFSAHDGYEDDDFRRYARTVAGDSARVPCDKQGRILVPKHLREDAGIDKDVMLVGAYDRAEIWDYPTWQQHRDGNRGSFSETARAVNRRRERKRDGDA